MSETVAPLAATPSRPRVRQVLRIVERGFAIFGIIMLIYISCFQLSVMGSGSMKPTLIGNGGAESDWILMEKVSHRFGSPRRWDLIGFHDSEGLHVMKRVVGLPGETVALKKDGTFLINGVTTPRPESINPIKYFPHGQLAMERAMPAGEGYFVLGDDSIDSQDSRWTSPVKKERVTGRPWLILWPLRRFGFVNP